MRKPRYILKPGSLVEVTTRTLQGRLLMVPETTLLCQGGPLGLKRHFMYSGPEARDDIAQGNALGGEALRLNGPRLSRPGSPPRPT
jgi:hypothetical protein